jgi:hypothetical protein
MEEQQRSQEHVLALERKFDWALRALIRGQEEVVEEIEYAFLRAEEQHERRYGEYLRDGTFVPYV